jgi:cytochrome c1
MIKNTLLALVLLAVSVGANSAARSAENQTPAKDMAYSFEGPFGTFDRGQLQRGYKVYKEVCANCHAMRLLSFRNLADHGGPEFSEEQVKALAATFQVMDGPNNDGDMFERPGLPSDRFPRPFPNDQIARIANNGALPLDLSLVTKSRAGWTGALRQLVNGIGGPEYVYSVLTGYEPEPAEAAAAKPEGMYYNPYFAGGHWISMPPPLTDGQVEFDDGAPNTVADMARDVSAFLAWAAEPKLEARKQLGLKVIVYLMVLAALMYFVKRRVWSGIEH